jgi:hypothetical protein
MLFNRDLAPANRIATGRPPNGYSEPLRHAPRVKIGIRGKMFASGPTLVRAAANVRRRICHPAFLMEF